MEVKYCEKCKQSTAHYKGMCLKCGKKEHSNPFGDLFDKPPKK